MPEQVSKKVTLRYPVSINGTTYPAGISLDLPTETANEAKRLDEIRLQSELSRMESKDENVYLGNQG